MELTDLRYFRAVASVRSFSRAARLAHVSAPALSKAVRKLEEELGCRLFERTTRRVALTRSGAALLEHARELLERADAIRDELHGIPAAPKGETRIGAMEVFSMALLPRAIADVVRAHPEVVPLVYEMIPAHMLRAIEQDRLDVGFTIGGYATAGVDCRSLGRSRAVLVCGRGHSLYRRGRVTKKDLLQHPFVVPRFWEAEHLPPLDQFPSERFPRRVGATIELLQMEIALVEAGAFLGFVPRVCVAQHLVDGRLKVLVGIDWRVAFELSALTPRGRPLKPAVEVLIERVRSHLRTRSG